MRGVRLNEEGQYNGRDRYDGRDRYEPQERHRDRDRYERLERRDKSTRFNPKLVILDFEGKMQPDDLLDWLSAVE